MNDWNLFCNLLGIQLVKFTLYPGRAEENAKDSINVTHNIRLLYIAT